MRKFKVICTGISGINGLLTPEMGEQQENVLPIDSFDKLVEEGAIIETEPAKEEKSKPKKQGKTNTKI